MKRVPLPPQCSYKNGGGEQNAWALVKLSNQGLIGVQKTTIAVNNKKARSHDLAFLVSPEKVTNHNRTIYF